MPKASIHRLDPTRELDLLLLEHPMMRKLFKPTPFAVALQAASLLAVAAGVFGILIWHISAVGP